MSLQSRVLWRTVKMTRTPTAKRMLRSGRRIAVVGGRALAFGLMPSIITHAIEARSWPPTQVDFEHYFESTLIDTALATALLDTYLSILRRD
jgi:hypothetical protein